jgi:uncharacterized membrane protein
MTTAQPPDRRTKVDRDVTQLLLIGHVALALFTLLILADIVDYQQDLESRCRYHDLDCSNPWVAAATWIAWVGSGLVLILDFVVATMRMMKRRRAVNVPLLGCVGQVAVVVAMVVVAHWSGR